MTALTIVAVIKAKPGQAERVKAELVKLIDTTRAETGCINYDLHQDNQNPAQFLFYENWASRALWQAHMGSRHLTDYLAATEGAIECFDIREMTLVG